MEYNNADILECLRENLFAVSIVTCCALFPRGYASEKTVVLFVFGFPRKLWVRPEIFKQHLGMLRAISSHANYNEIRL